VNHIVTATAGSAHMERVACISTSSMSDGPGSLRRAPLRMRISSTLPVSQATSTPFTPMRSSPSRLSSGAGFFTVQECSRLPLDSNHDLASRTALLSPSWA
jgi:hypothetical protein